MSTSNDSADDRDPPGTVRDRRSPYALYLVDSGAYVEFLAQERQMGEPCLHCGSSVGGWRRSIHRHGDYLGSLCHGCATKDPELWRRYYRDAERLD